LTVILVFPVADKKHRYLVCEEIQKFVCHVDVQEISAEECRSLVQGWKEKLTNCAAGDHRWGVFFARK